ncbi:hypothetical protein [Anaerostipes faecalis]|uniref:hypothetical protein n=1 Tax=Anaerostipes faecalis TaxID=2738446 RepID=UPI000952FAD4|nr:hypothetical protein BHF70_01915 [Anaerostipes sp. 494a]
MSNGIIKLITKYALSYGDDPHDTSMIRYGNSLYHRTGSSLYKKSKKYIKFGTMLVSARKEN